jgi:hypothetical protein
MTSEVLSSIAFEPMNRNVPVAGAVDTERERMKATAMICAGVLAAAVACAPRTAQTPADALPATLRSQMAAHDALAWSATRRLAWTDFQGIPPARGDESALTSYSLFHGASCTGKTFEFRAVAAFLPRQSWVRPAVLANAASSSRTLRHEQTHFDLSEVHTRRMRRYFAELYQPCMKTTEELDALAQRFVREEAAAQRQYDIETNHGRVPRKQTEWETEVGRQLASLGRFQ